MDADNDDDDADADAGDDDDDQTFVHSTYSTVTCYSSERVGWGEVGEGGYGTLRPTSKYNHVLNICLCNTQIFQCCSPERCFRRSGEQ